MRWDIFYFTGTGNSLKIAKDISEKIGTGNIYPIKGRNIKKNEELSKNIGVVFPIYIFGLPKIVENFLNDIKNVDKIFLVANYATTPGSALEDGYKIIKKKKSIELAGIYGVKMPSNNIILRNSQMDIDIESIIESEEKYIDEIVLDLRENNKTVKPKNILFRTNFIKKWGRLKIPSISKNFYTDENCLECGKCQKTCPVNNIYLEDGKPKWKDQCEGCLACIQWCENEAIQYKSVTINRKRYRNPYITIDEIIGKRTDC